MKAEFGGGYMYMKQDKTPIESVEACIMQDLVAPGRFVNRIFNVINIEENFPDSFNHSFRIKGDIKNGIG